ncbi:MAG: ATP-binding protein [Nocardioidaceae bacterium]|nr:ATP-binding protein [Nocardioidaceae bacterium]
MVRDRMGTDERRLAVAMDAMIVLEPHPSSAARARRWVGEQLRLLGRDDLVDSAVLATSEVVTNAILHARTQITVRVVGSSDTSGAERICVSDLSGEPLRAVQERDEVWSSGRGLRILSAVTRQWGVDAEHPGKCVWFEPVPQAETPADADLDLVGWEGLDLTGLADLSGAEEGSSPASGSVVVVLQDAPLQLLWRARRRYCDIKREMILLLSVEEWDTPRRLVELAHQMDPLPAGFIGDIDESGPAPTGEQTVNAYLDVETVQQLTAAADLFDEVDAYCRAEHLLTLAASQTEATARRWVLSEIGRQVNGLAPQPWTAYLPRQ